MGRTGEGTLERTLRRARKSDVALREKNDAGSFTVVLVVAGDFCLRRLDRCDRRIVCGQRFQPVCADDRADGPEDAHAIPTGGFGGVHRAVCIREDIIERLAVHRRERDADTAGNERTGRPGGDRLGQRADDPISKRQHVILCADRGTNDRKFVAADTCDEIVLARGRTQARGDLDQNAIADRMSECIVDFLKTIEIDEKKGDRPSGGCGRLEQRGGGIAKATAIEGPVSES